MHYHPSLSCPLNKKSPPSLGARVAGSGGGGLYGRPPGCGQTHYQHNTYKAHPTLIPPKTHHSPITNHKGDLAVALDNSTQTRQPTPQMARPLTIPCYHLALPPE